MYTYEEEVEGRWVPLAGCRCVVPPGLAGPHAGVAAEGPLSVAKLPPAPWWPSTVGIAAALGVLLCQQCMAPAPLSLPTCSPALLPSPSPAPPATCPALQEAYRADQRAA